VSTKNILNITFILCLIFTLTNCNEKAAHSQKMTGNPDHPSEKIINEKIVTVNKKEYDDRILKLANGDTTGFWPVKPQPYPLKGAILPFKRIVAYYGNLYSKNMGILGEYPPEELWEKLHMEIDAWEKADPSTPVQPAIHYIAVVAQQSPMNDGTYRMRMPEHQIDSALAIANMGNAIVFLDIQVGLSTVEQELPLLEKYLKMPHVHLAIDPEFSMKDGTPPGKKIGTYDAKDINFCSDFLVNLVQENNLPPKIFVIHRFTQHMITNYKQIKLHPEVQIVINMDGWGAPALKLNTYKQYIWKEPVQFTGFKLFYKNDLRQFPHRMLTPVELMRLQPHPIYIQYQ